MSLELMLEALESKDTSRAYEVLKELERISDEMDELYPYIEMFVQMTENDKYVIRVRGFRLFCKQAKWDCDNKINKYIEKVLIVLNDEKPTAVRQALAALKDVILYKKELRELIACKISSIDFHRYKDTMHSLIYNDIQNLIDIIENS